MTELAQLSAKVDRVLQLLETKPRGDLTRKQFAKEAGISAKTVARKIASREILTRKGRIPASELKKFTSF